MSDNSRYRSSIKMELARGLGYTTMVINNTYLGVKSFTDLASKSTQGKNFDLDSTHKTLSINNLPVE